MIDTTLPGILKFMDFQQTIPFDLQSGWSLKTLMWDPAPPTTHPPTTPYNGELRCNHPSSYPTL